MMNSDSFNIVHTKLPSFDRYKKLFIQGKKYSATRALQYEIISNRSFKGKILDFGGGEKASYRHLIKCDEYNAVNIDKAMEPTWITSVGDKIPCEDNLYDIAISFNTFEHIYDVNFVINDIYRSLKDGGEFVTSVPFLFPVHAHPDDFFRPTMSWWHRSLSDAGFKEIKITPIIWGPFSTGAICSGLPGPFRGLRTHINLLLDILYAKMKCGNNSKNIHFNDNIYNHALAFFVEARK